MKPLFELPELVTLSGKPITPNMNEDGIESAFFGTNQCPTGSGTNNACPQGSGLVGS